MIKIKEIYPPLQQSNEKNIYKNESGKEKSKKKRKVMKILGLIVIVFLGIGAILFGSAYYMRDSKKKSTVAEPFKNNSNNNNPPINPKLNSTKKKQENDEKEITDKSVELKSSINNSESKPKNSNDFKSNSNDLKSNSNDFKSKTNSSEYQTKPHSPPPTTTNQFFINNNRVDQNHLPVDLSSIAQPKYKDNHDRIQIQNSNQAKINYQNNNTLKSQSPEFDKLLTNSNVNTKERFIVPDENIPKLMIEKNKQEPLLAIKSHEKVANASSNQIVRNNQVDKNNIELKKANPNPKLTISSKSIEKIVKDINVEKTSTIIPQSKDQLNYENSIENNYVIVENDQNSNKVTNKKSNQNSSESAENASTAKYFEAIKKNNLKSLQKIVYLKKDLTELNDKGFNAIHLAASLLNIEAMKILVNSGKFDLESTTLNGARYTALMLSCMNSKNQKSKALDLISFLAEKGANVDAMDSNNLTPLVIAVGNSDQALVEHLLKLGANPNIGLMSENNSILHRAMIPCRVEIIKALIEYNADVYSVNGRNRAPIHEAAIRGCLAGLRELVLTKKVDINLKSPIESDEKYDHMHKHRCLFGATPLHYAVNSNNFDVMKFLVQMGADIEAEDELKKSVLMIAKDRGDTSMIKYFEEQEWTRQKKREELARESQERCLFEKHDKQ